MRRTMWLLAFALWPSSGGAADEECGYTLPADIAPHVEQGACVQWAESADLDRDGDDDMVLVLEKPKQPSAGIDGGGIHRALLVLTSGPEGELRIAKRNDRIIPCTTCWGACGDPLSGLEARSGTFAVKLESGCSAWKGEVTYTFAYSRKDRTWQLVKVREEEINTYDRAKGSTTISIPPRDFGKIDIAAFDPEHWKGQGPK